MELTALGTEERTAFSDALRRGEPVHLVLSDDLPRDLRLDELAPLCASIRAPDPRTQAAMDAFLAPRGGPDRPERVTAVIPCSRGLPIGVSALRDQDVRVRVLVASNGDGPRRVPGAEVVRVDGEGAHLRLTVEDARSLKRRTVDPRRTRVRPIED